MGMLDELKIWGVDIEDASSRCLNNVALLERMLKKLPSSVKSIEVLPLIEANDIAQAIVNAHTLKGVMGNLSVTSLYNLYTNIVNLLRENKIDEAIVLQKEAIVKQEDLFAIISKYID